MLPVANLILLVNVMLLSSGEYILCFHLIKDLPLSFDGNIIFIMPIILINIIYKYNLPILFWQ